jgi:hypothetical protein
MDALDYTLITQDNLDAFAPLIPVSLCRDLRAGEATALGSLLLDCPNGVLVFSLQENHALIRSLYVDQYDRRHGTGTFLVEKLRELLSALPGIYSIRAILPGDADQTGAAAFFEAAGFRLSGVESRAARFRLAQLEDSPLLMRSIPLPCRSGAALGGDVLADYQRRLTADGEFLMDKSLTDPVVRQDLSQYLVRDGAVRGCAVVTEEAGALALALVCCHEGKEAVFSLLSSTLRAAMAQCPPETPVTLETVNPASRSILEKLIPSADLAVKHIAVLAV